MGFAKLGLDLSKYIWKVNETSVLLTALYKQFINMLLVIDTSWQYTDGLHMQQNICHSDDICNEAPV